MEIAWWVLVLLVLLFVALVWRISVLSKNLRRARNELLKCESIAREDIDDARLGDAEGHD